MAKINFFLLFMTIYFRASSSFHIFYGFRERNNTMITYCQREKKQKKKVKKYYLKGNFC